MSKIYVAYVNEGTKSEEGDFQIEGTDQVLEVCRSIEAMRDACQQDAYDRNEGEDMAQLSWNASGVTGSTRQLFDVYENGLIYEITELTLPE